MHCLKLFGEPLAAHAVYTEQLKSTVSNLNLKISPLPVEEYWKDIQCFKAKYKRRSLECMEGWRKYYCKFITFEEVDGAVDTLLSGVFQT